MGLKYNSGLRAKTLDALVSKNPKRSRAEIDFVVFSMIKAIDKRVYSNQKYNLVIPNLGRIHTHGNVVNQTLKKISKRATAYVKKKHDFSIEMLLF